MPFDPALPRTGSRASSAEMRSQFTSLKALIDAIPPPIPGPPGPQGEQGPQGYSGRDGAEGPTGPQGPAGADGRSIVNVYDDGSGRAIVQMSDGTTYGPFAIASGPVGPQGDPGPQGPEGRYVSGVADDGVGRAIIQMSDGSTYGPFTVATGPQGAQGPAGEVTTSALNDAISAALAATSANSNGIPILDMTVSDPPTQMEMQTIATRLDQLILALRR